MAAQTYELSELLVDVLGVEDVGAYYPHRVTYHPTCHSLRMLRVGDKPLRLLRHVRGIDLVELPAADQCCGFGGTFALKNADTSTAMLADKMRHVLSTGAEVVTAGDASCLMHIGGGLSRLRSGAGPVHLAEILASAPTTPREAHEHVPRACPYVARRGVGHLRGDAAVPRPRPGRRWPTPSCGATSATPPPTIRDKRAAVVAEVDDWEELRRAGAAIKTDTMARLAELLEQLEAQVTARGGVGALGPRRQRGQPRSSPIWCGPPAQTEVVKVKSMATQEIGLNEALEAAGIEAKETDLAELIVQLGHDRPVAHPGAGDPPQPRARSGRSSCGRCPGVRPDAHRRAAPAGDGRPRAPAANVPAGQGRRSPAPTSQSPRPARCVVVESEGNGRMCLTLPETLITVMGIEKVVPTWSRPRGVPAAAAPLVDRASG